MADSPKNGGGNGDGEDDSMGEDVRLVHQLMAYDGGHDGDGSHHDDFH